MIIKFVVKVIEIFKKKPRISISAEQKQEVVHTVKRTFGFEDDLRVQFDPKYREKKLKKKHKETSNPSKPSLKDRVQNVELTLTKLEVDINWIKRFFWFLLGLLLALKFGVR